MMLKIGMIAVMSMLTVATGASAANWVSSGASGSLGDKCKKHPGEIIGAVSGAGYSIVSKQAFSSLSMNFVLCVRKNSNGAEELWQFESLGGGIMCRTGHRTGVGDSCSNPLP